MVRQHFWSDANHLECLRLGTIWAFLGQGSQGLRVTVFTAERTPTNSILQQALKDCKTRLAPTVLILNLYPEGLSLCGTIDDQPTVLHCTDASQVERLFQSALQLTDKNSVIRLFDAC